MATRTLEQTSTDPINGIVRRFSHHVLTDHADDQLAVVLATQETKDEEDEEKALVLKQQWMSLFIPGATQHFETEEEKLLDQSSQDLAKAWKEFQKCIPKEHRAQIQDGPPDFNEVAKAVATAHTAWKAKEKGKIAKFKNHFGNLCQSLYDFKDVFAVIPNQDKYVCLLTGTFAAIVKATTNYKKIADGISSCLDNLGEDISYWKRQLEIHADNTFMKRYIAQLYVLVFQLLVDIMSWYKSSIKRIGHSFDSQALDKIIKLKRDKMQILAQRLENEGKLVTEANVKTLVTASENQNVDIEKVLERFLGEVEGRFMGKVEGIVAKSIQKSLRQEAKAILWDHQQRGSSRSLPDTENVRLLEDSPASNSQIYTKAQIQASALRLQKFQQQGLVEKLTSRSQGLDVNIEVLRRITRWSKAPVSQALWICGPFQASVPSRYTLAAANLISAAQKARIPVLAYLCQRDGPKVPVDDDEDLDENGKRSRVAALVNSLISQFVGIIPTDAVETQMDYSTTRFASVDGTIDTLPKAVSLLKDLLAIRPTLMFCFIDGLQLFKGRISQVEAQALKDVIDMFRFTKQDSLEDPPRVVKTLYTTDGFCERLGILKGDERLNVLDFEFEDRVGPEADAVEMNGRRII